MTVNGEPLGTIDLELNYDITPKTAQNFRYIGRTPLGKRSMPQLEQFIDEFNK